MTFINRLTKANNAIYIVIIINLIRLAILPFIGNNNAITLTPTDAEYTTISSLINGFIATSFENSYLFLKAYNFILTCLIQILFFNFSSKIIRSDRKYWVLILFSTSFFITKLGYITNGNTLLILSWIISLNLLYSAIFNNKKRLCFWSGLSIGIAFTINFVSLFIPLGTFIFILFSTQYRKLFKTYQPYLTLLIITAFIIFTNLTKIDNYLGASSIDKTLLSSSITHFSSYNLILLVGYQVFILMPTLYIGLWWILSKYTGRIFNKPNQINPELWFLLCFFVPMFLGFYMTIFFNLIPLDWLTPAYITGIIFFGKFVKYRWVKFNYLMIILIHFIAYSYQMINFPLQSILENWIQ